MEKKREDEVPARKGRACCAHGRAVASCALTWLLLPLAISSPVEGQDPPTDLEAVANGDSAIDLSWTAPSVGFGEQISGYKIESTSDTTMTWTVLNANTNSTTAAHRHSGLPPDTTVYYRVSVIVQTLGGPQTSSPSNVAGATTESAPVVGTPGTPTALVANAESPEDILLTWEEPADTGTSAITGYQIEVSTDKGINWTDLVANTNDTDEDYIHTGLTPDTTLHYRVSAINDEGAGSPSDVAFATTPRVTETGAPGAPTNLVAKASGQTAIDLDWEPPADTGKSSIGAYRIEVSNDSIAWTDLEKSFTGGSSVPPTEYGHTGLAPDTKRYYRVSAINFFGTGPPSNVASATTDAPTGDGTPGPPENLEASPKTSE